MCESVVIKMSSNLLTKATVIVKTFKYSKPRQNASLLLKLPDKITNVPSIIDIIVEIRKYKDILNQNGFLRTADIRISVTRPLNLNIAPKLRSFDLLSSNRY